LKKQREWNIDKFTYSKNSSNRLILRITRQMQIPMQVNVHMYVVTYIFRSWQYFKYYAGPHRIKWIDKCLYSCRLSPLRRFSKKDWDSGRLLPGNKIAASFVR
jgi:hypothetical protein